MVASQKPHSEEGVTGAENLCGNTWWVMSQKKRRSKRRNWKKLMIWIGIRIKTLKKEFNK